MIDASVGLKWALNDEDMVVEANALRKAATSGTVELIAPILWVYEVVNGLLVAARRARIGQDASRQALDDIVATDVHFLDPPAEKVYELAIRYNISGYDAAYLTLAEELDVPFWTGDRRFYDIIHARASRVHWIGDYK